MSATPTIEQLQRATTPQEIVWLMQQLIDDRTETTIAPLISTLIQTLQHHHPAVIAAAINHLVQLATVAVEPLLAAFQACRDQSVQAAIVQTLAKIGDDRATDLLLEVVGVEVANHCQGSVRRIAARGLGQIGKTTSDRALVPLIVNKLTWIAHHAEDWALRYAAVVSLQEIGTTEAIAVIKQALLQESDVVVQGRMAAALATQSIGTLSR